MGNALHVAVREILEQPGEFEVVRGGDVYFGRGLWCTPGSVRKGDKVSAAQVCEWIENGVFVEDRAAVSSAGFHEYGAHSPTCAALDEFHRAGPRPCDCGLEKVRALATTGRAA